MMRTRFITAVVIVSWLSSQTLAYGPRGHRTVGAIADRRLAAEPVQVKISNLLDGLTLAEAALLPDQIKAWDRKPPSDPNAFHVIGHPGIDAQLVAFWMANPPTSHNPTHMPPNHHWFHYTDVPVLGSGKYEDGHVGRSDFDVVKMITYCSGVLKGTIPEDNDRKITKPVAVILLAHYVGDIHQPLHVGAEYFDSDGKPVDADAHPESFADEGGGSLTLILDEPSDHGHPHSAFKLHGYWDDETVDTAFDLAIAEIRSQRGASRGEISDDDIARWLASHEPANWKMPAGLDIDKWSVAWADEILPIAHEAHERLTFSHIRLNSMTKTASGQAIEKPIAGGERYRDWSGKVVREELHKAGWRLAELLKRCVE